MISFDLHVEATTTVIEAELTAAGETWKGEVVSAPAETFSLQLQGLSLIQRLLGAVQSEMAEHERHLPAWWPRSPHNE